MQVFGEKGGNNMKTETKYSNEPISFRVVEDFLPPPSNLIAKQETTKITISLNKSSIDFLKSKARQHKRQIPKNDPPSFG